MLTRRLIGVASAAVLAALALPTIASAQEKKTIRAVMHAPLRITDPIITSRVAHLRLTGEGERRLSAVNAVLRHERETLAEVLGKLEQSF